jgi:hypothetical protein
MTGAVEPADAPQHLRGNIAGDRSVLSMTESSAPEFSSHAATYVASPGSNPVRVAGPDASVQHRQACAQPPHRDRGSRERVPDALRVSSTRHKIRRS